MTECTQTKFTFQAHSSRQVIGQFDGSTLTAEFPAEADVSPGNHIRIMFDPNNLHLFDSTSGNAIGHSKSAVDSRPIHTGTPAAAQAGGPTSDGQPATELASEPAAAPTPPGS